jgi:tellurite resistance protein
MHANDHMSAAEAARAQHLIWSMKRFRRKSGETVGRGIERMRQFVSEHGPGTVLASAVRGIPARLRLPAFGLTVDLLLADGTIEPTERRFLNKLAADLRLDIGEARRIVEAMLVKNQA